MKTATKQRERQEHGHRECSWGGLIWRVNLVAAYLLIMAAPEARATDYQWGLGLGPLTTEWNGLSNWSPAFSYPDGTNDTATINTTVEDAFSPFLNLNVTIGNLFVGNSPNALFLNGHTMVVNGGTHSGTTEVIGGAIFVGDGILDTDHLRIRNGGAVFSHNRVQVDTSAVIDAGGQFGGSGSLEIGGSTDFVNNGLITANIGTLTIERFGSAEFDWDGTGNQGAELDVRNGGTMVIDMPINGAGSDGFNGTIYVGNANGGATFDVRTPWRLGGGVGDTGIMEMRGGVVTGEGFTVDSTAYITGNGDIEIAADATENLVLSGSLFVEVDPNNFNPNFPHTRTVNIRRLGGTSEFDWDGGDGSSIHVDDSAHLVIDMPIRSGDEFNGTMSVDPGAMLTINTDWGLGELSATEAQAVLNLTGGVGFYSGPAVVNGTGAMTVNESNTEINVLAEEAQILSDLTMHDGDVKMSPNTTLMLGNAYFGPNAGIEVSTGTSIRGTAGEIVVDGVISGGQLIHGAGSMRLNGANTYSGGTNVDSGKLTVNTNSLPAAGGVNVFNAGELEFDQNFTGSYAGVIAAGGDVTKSGSGTVILTANNTYTGDTTVNAGTLEVSGSLSEFTDLIVNHPGRFETNVDQTVNSLNGNGTVDVDSVSAELTVGRAGTSSGSGTFSGTVTGPGGLTKEGTGTLNLTTSHGYTGATTVNEGTLSLNGSGRLANASALIVNSGGTFHTTEPDAIWSLDGDGTIDIESPGALVVGNFGNAGGTGTFSGLIQGDGVFTKRGTGTLTVSGANTYSGATHVDEGTLRVTNTTGSATGSSPVDIQADGTLGGDGSVGGVVDNRGSVSPGPSIETLTLGSSYDQTSTGSYDVEIDAVSNDLLAVAGVATLDGSLEVDLLGGFLPTLGETFEVMTYASVTGEFASSTGLDAATGLFLAPTYGATSLILEAVYAGDVNRDGKVDGLDANVVAANFLSSGVGFENGDANLDGTVNGLDANVIAGNFLAGVPATAVPEPSGMMLAGLGIVLSALRRRRPR